MPMVIEKQWRGLVCREQNEAHFQGKTAFHLGEEVWFQRVRIVLILGSFVVPDFHLPL